MCLRVACTNIVRTLVLFMRSKAKVNRVHFAEMGRDMSQIAPSILAADFNCLGKQIHELEENEVKYLHIDVMDGIFVPSISFGMPVITSIRKESHLYFDVHLMIREPIRYIEEFVKNGADSITVHVEACEDVKATLQNIKDQGIQCGITLNPETPVERVLPYLDMVDMVLVMSVHPGFGGQKLIPDTLKKVEYLAELRKERDLCYDIEIDGGVNQRNLGDVISAGVDIVVAGTAVFRGDITQNLKNIKEVMTNAS